MPLFTLLPASSLLNLQLIEVRCPIVFYIVIMVPSHTKVQTRKPRLEVFRAITIFIWSLGNVHASLNRSKLIRKPMACHEKSLGAVSTTVECHTYGIPIRQSVCGKTMRSHPDVCSTRCYVASQNKDEKLRYGIFQNVIS